MVSGFKLKRIFIIEADVFSQRDFELIHIYMLQRLNPKNNKLIIKSIPLNRKMETFILKYD